MSQTNIPNLVKPINLRDLCTKGATFEISPEEDFKGKNNFVNTFNELDITNTGVHEDGTATDKNNFTKGAAGDKTFKEIASTMSSIEKNGHVKKSLLKEGYGGAVTADVEVHFHYNAFWELQNEPFDSTYMRGYPQKIRPSEGEILPGIEIALLSMKLGEESSFLISYEMLYGDRGFPPRIPPKSDALFIIEIEYILPFVRELSPEESKLFPMVLKNVIILHSQGVQGFKKGTINAAIKHFQSAVEMLEKSRMANDEEVETQQNWLIKLFINLAVAFNKEKKPYKARSMCNELIKMTDINKNAKILFQFGRALFEMKEFEQAKEKLLIAQKLEPNNTEIGKELSKLEKQIIIERKFEIDFYSKALGFKTQKQPTTVENLSKDFKDEVRSCLNIFIEKDGEKEMVLNGVYTGDEIQYFKTVAKDMNLNFEKHCYHTQPSYIFRKK